MSRALFARTLQEVRALKEALKIKRNKAGHVYQVDPSGLQSILLHGDPRGVPVRIRWVPQGLFFLPGHEGPTTQLVTEAKAWEMLGLDKPKNPRNPTADLTPEKVPTLFPAPPLPHPDTLEIIIGEAFRPLFFNTRYTLFKGGRGSGKSTAIALFGMLLSRTRNSRFLFTREYQNSIAASSKQLLDDIREKFEWQQEFRSTLTAIKNNVTGSDFGFVGLQNPDSVKSREAVDICAVDEAQAVSARSWGKLTPTIRKPGSRILLALNPEDPDNAVEAEFAGVTVTKDAIVVECNYDANPFFFQTALPADMHQAVLRQPEDAAHIWYGAQISHSEAKIFRNWEVRRLTDAEIGTDVEEYRGMDFSRGGSDPHALISFKFSAMNKRLYVNYETVGYATLDELPDLVSEMPNSKVVPIPADNANPDIIQFLAARGWPIYGAAKPKGSVNAGILWLRGLEIIISPDCPHTAQEFKDYEWVQDKKTGKIKNEPVDENNHTIDAIRYGASENGLMSVAGNPDGTGGVVFLGGKRHKKNRDKVH